MSGCSADRVETELLARVETILGQALTSLHLRTSAIPCIHAAATRRSPATSPDLSTSFMSLVPHLSAVSARRCVDEIGSGPFTAVPVERGDDLLGVLVTWRGRSGEHRRAALPAGGGRTARPRLAAPRWRRHPGAGSRATSTEPRPTSSAG